MKEYISVIFIKGLLPGCRVFKLIHLFKAGKVRIQELIPVGRRYFFLEDLRLTLTYKLRFSRYLFRSKRGVTGICGSTVNTCNHILPSRKSPLIDSLSSYKVDAIHFATRASIKQTDSQPPYEAVDRPTSFSDFVVGATRPLPRSLL